MRSILEVERSAYGTNVTYAAIVDVERHRHRARLPADGRADRRRAGGPRRSSSKPARSSSCAPSTPTATFEVRQQMLAGDEQFGSIRIGVSMLLIRDELREALRAAPPAASSSRWSSSSLVAVVLAQWMLRPIHVIQSGLTRLGRGELDVSLDLPGEEFRDLGSSFEAVSAQLSAVAREAAAVRVNRPRVGHGEPRGRGRAVLAVRRGDLHQRRDEGAVPGARANIRRCGR